MTNARVFIKDLLETLGVTVRQTKPEGKVELPLITYAEITNINIELWHDRFSYQFDVYANTFEEAVDLIHKVDDAVTALGFNRDYVSPDTQARVDTDLYHKAASYTADINTLTGNIYQNHTTINNQEEEENG